MVEVLYMLADQRVKLVQISFAERFYNWSMVVDLLEAVRDIGDLDTWIKWIC